MRTILLLSLLALIFATGASAFQGVGCFEYYKFQDGAQLTDFRADKVSFAPDDRVALSYNIVNTMDMPIVQGKVRVQIFYMDPTQGETMVDEFFVPGTVSLQPNTFAKEDVFWQIPSDAPQGHYVAKLYFIVGESMNLAGISFSAYGPPGIAGQQTSFDVTDSPHPSYLYFDKQNTWLAGTPYAFGAFIPTYTESKPLTLRTKLRNVGGARTVDIQMTVYAWDDAVEQNLVQALTQTISKSLPNDSSGDVVFHLPSMQPGSYEVRLVATSGAKSALQKMRFSVSGDKARVQYMALTAFPVVGPNAKVFVCYSSSADYMHGFGGKLTAEVRDRSGAVVWSDSFQANLTPKPTGAIAQLTPPGNMDYANLTVTLQDGTGQVLDKQTLTYDSGLFRVGDLGLQITAPSSASPGQSVDYTVSVKDSQGKPVNGQVLLYLENSNQQVIDYATLDVQGTLSDALDAPDQPGAYSLKGVETASGATGRATIQVREPASAQAPKASATPSSLSWEGVVLALIVITIVILAIVLVRRKK